MFPTEKGNGLVQAAEGPHVLQRLVRTNTILVLTMFNETTLSQAPWEGTCAVMSGKLRAFVQPAHLL